MTFTAATIAVLLLCFCNLWFFSPFPDSCKEPLEGYSRVPSSGATWILLLYSGFVGSLAFLQLCWLCRPVSEDEDGHANSVIAYLEQREEDLQVFVSVLVALASGFLSLIILNIWEELLSFCDVIHWAPYGVLLILDLLMFTYWGWTVMLLLFLFYWSCLIPRLQSTEEISA